MQRRAILNGRPENSLTPSAVSGRADGMIGKSSHPVGSDRARRAPKKMPPERAVISRFLDPLRRLRDTAPIRSDVRDAPCKASI